MKIVSQTVLSLSAEYITILVCRLFFMLDIGAESGKTVCETIYTTAFFQLCTVHSKCAVCNVCIMS